MCLDEACPLMGQSYARTVAPIVMAVTGRITFKRWGLVKSEWDGAPSGGVSVNLMGLD